MKIARRPKKIYILGNIGVGKSSLCNFSVYYKEKSDLEIKKNAEFLAGTGADSCTAECQCAKSSRHVSDNPTLATLRVVDSPGLGAGPAMS